MKLKLWTVAFGFGMGVGISAVGIYLRVPQLAVYFTSAVVTAFIIKALNRPY